MTTLSTTQANDFSSTDAIETVTVGTAGYYDITAKGAQGGSGGSAAGGDGALASGEVYLNAGADLLIVVGDVGTNGTEGGGGGGGSFVIEINDGSGGVDVNEVIAGGGGGGGRTLGGSGDGGLAVGNGGIGGAQRGNGGAGGNNGAGGAGGGNNGGGGGGFTGGAPKGNSGTVATEVTKETFAGGASYAPYGGAGGFGGGGGGLDGGGGGGGYGGGGGGDPGGAGGGGGSFVSATATDVTLTASANSGVGSVDITYDPSCYCAGTFILTDKAEAAVETLQRGDLVMTTEGVARPISWIGRRTVSAAFADPIRCWPIRIMAGALGDNVPSRDLRLSPDHALLVAGVLIHAGALVNGTSIFRETTVPRNFIYYHVELDDHSLIFAENTPAETFVDNVDRLGFDNWSEHEALYPEGKPIEEMPYPRAKGRRQVPMHIRAALDARAKELGAAEILAVA